MWCLRRAPLRATQGTPDGKSGVLAFHATGNRFFHAQDAPEGRTESMPRADPMVLGRSVGCFIATGISGRSAMGWWFTGTCGLQRCMPALQGPPTGDAWLIDGRSLMEEGHAHRTRTRVAVIRRALGGVRRSMQGNGTNRDRRVFHFAVCRNAESSVGNQPKETGMRSFDVNSAPGSTRGIPPSIESAVA